MTMVGILRNITWKYIIAFVGTIVMFCVLRGLFLFLGSSFDHSQNRFSGLELKRDNWNLIGSHPLSMQTEVNQNVGEIDKNIHLMFIFFGANQNDRLRSSMQRCLTSLFKTSADPFIGLRLTVHVLGDEASFSSLQDILDEMEIKKQPKVVYHDLTKFPETLSLMKDINNIVSKDKHPFSLPYFYASLFMHKILPHAISRLIMLDVDVVFKSDVSQLFSIFNNFTDANIIGMARENQPVYRYVLYEFREANPGSRVGGPPPDGLTGFNSGVVLLDLSKMRQSSEYNSILTSEKLVRSVEKYTFQGNLGDQDVFTLMSLEHEHLFYVLPCSWNRQLCRWWQKSDFEHVFDSYFSCEEEIHIVHGNCQTEIE